jgi:hypothetical protein
VGRDSPVVWTTSVLGPDRSSLNSSLSYQPWWCVVSVSWAIVTVTVTITISMIVAIAVTRTTTRRISIIITTMLTPTFHIRPRYPPFTLALSLLFYTSVMLRQPRL